MPPARRHHGGAVQLGGGTAPLAHRLARRLCAAGTPSRPQGAPPPSSPPASSARPRQLNRTTSINSGTGLAGSPTRFSSPLISSSPSTNQQPQQQPQPQQPQPTSSTTKPLNLVGMNVHGTFNNQQDILHWMKKPLFVREGETNGFLSGKDAAEKLQNESTRRDPYQYDYFESLKESTEALAPVFEKHPRTAWVMKQLMEPELFVSFRIPWTDDANNTRINRGYRVLYSTTPGINYRGPLVFSRKLSYGAMRMLAFEQAMKNALASNPSREGVVERGFAGGADLDVAGKSQEELRRFMHAYVKACLPFLSTKKKIMLDRGYPGVNVTRELGEYMLSGYKKEVDPLITGEDLFSFGADFSSWGDAAHVAEFAVHLAERALSSAKNIAGVQGKKCMIVGLDERSLALAKTLAGPQFGALVACITDSTGTLLDSNGLGEEALELMMRQFAAAPTGGIVVRDLKRVSPTARFIGAAGNSSSSSSLPQAAFPEGGVEVLFVGSHHGDFSADDAALIAEHSPRLAGVFELADRACAPNAVRLLESRGIVFAPSKLMGAAPPSSSRAQQDLRRAAVAVYDHVVLKGSQYGASSSASLVRQGSILAAFDRLAQDERVFS